MNHPFSAYSRRSDPSSFRLGEVLGITVRVHWMWFLVPILLLPAGGAAALVMLVVLFGSVFLHEMGHSLVARHYGIQVLDITFWPLGGMARMSELPEDSKIEGAIAIAGPLVNFALAALCLPAIIGLGLVGLEGLSLFAINFAVINLMLGLFNLIPAFPMDGGRVLRAYLARTRDWVTATEMAVKTGRIAAVVMVIAALVFLVKGPSLCMLPLIAAFVWYAGARELWAVRLRHGYSPFGGIPDASPFAGSEPPAAWTESEVRSERSEPFRPDSAGLPRRRPGRGFSEEELRELERFHGRLQRRPPS